MPRAFNGIYCVFLLAATMAGAVTSTTKAAPASEEIQEHRHLEKLVEQYWLSKKLDKLDLLAEQWRIRQDRTSSGYWKLSLLYNKFDNELLIPTLGNIPQDNELQSIDRWHDETPNSPVPIILKALILLRQAQGIHVMTRNGRILRRGPVTDTRTLHFLDAARNLLEQNKAVAASDPHWYTAYLRMLRLRIASDEEISRIHAEALSAHPLYYQTHFETFRHYVMWWGFDIYRLDEFAKTVLTATRQREGNMVYARLYEDAALELNYGAPFRPSKEHWENIRAGFEEIYVTYPTDWNAQQFAFNACMAQDTNTLRQRFKLIRQSPAHEIWGNPSIYRQCSDTAKP